jgi:hypothetical protein
MLLLQGMTSAQLIYQPSKFQKIRHAEERTMLAYDHLRVRSNQVRPLWRNRADRRIIDLQQKTPSRPVVPLAHAGELLAAEWMKRMRDAHKTRRGGRNTCTLN